MGAKRIQHWSDAAPANECHDDVDAVGRVNLRKHLIADPRLTGGICQQRSIEERNERFSDFFRETVWLSGHHGTQHRSRHGRALTVCAWNLFNQATRKRDAYCDPFAIVDIANRTLDHAGKVKSYAVRGLRRSKFGSMDLQPLVKRAQLGFKRLSNQNFIQTALMSHDTDIMDRTALRLSAGHLILPVCWSKSTRSGATVSRGPPPSRLLQAFPPMMRSLGGYSSRIPVYPRVQAGGAANISIVAARLAGRSGKRRKSKGDCQFRFFETLRR
jgi:hypothetical protein